MLNESTTPQPRPYVQRRRAESQERTRRRITEAAVELHGSIGPARTTISAIADRAGVRRATVYRHFPDDRALFMACSGMFAERNPPPDPALWSGVDDPERRLAIALDAHYAWWERVGDMLVRVLADAPQLPIIEEIQAPRRAFMAWMEGELARGWGARGRRAARLRAAIGLALDFPTWRALQARGLDRRECVALMVALARATAGPG